MIKTFLTAFFCSVILVYPQDRAEWFPSQLNIQPFTANMLEARSGFMNLLGKSSIQLNIGTSSDIYRSVEGKRTISFGGDFFTYTRLHGSGEFHFPVETIDYFFGINAGYKISDAASEYGFRLRISHISAHLVDGSYDYVIDDWRDYKRPRVYSREFIELFPFYRMDRFRLYAGLTYLFHTSPDEFGKSIYQVGIDYFMNQLWQSLTPFAAYDFKLEKVSSYSGTNQISVGVKFGDYDKKGLSILFNFISGKSVHGEYFDINEQYSSIGFNLEL